MNGLIILAAGASSRLGTPKQVLQYKGKSLLRHAVAAAVHAGCQPVMVVTGAHAEQVMPEMMDEPVLIVHNDQWREGMASSIRCGLTLLQQVAPEATGVVCMLCDQPFADATLIHRLVQTKLSSGKGIVGCAYNGVTGVPALFDRAYFPALLSLKGEEGARQLFQQYAHAVTSIPFPLGSIDIDSPADAERLHSINHP